MSLFLPLAIGTELTNLPSTPSVRILDRNYVGSFETTTIQSDSPTALIEWLNTNGYEQSANVETVITDYVKRGWVFVASRLTRDENLSFATPHPLGFRFKTDRPVYPLQLTDVGNGPLNINLYIFANQRASVPNFTTELCGQLSAPDQHSRFRQPGSTNTYPLVHPELKRIVGDSKTITKLTATLSPAQMQQDAFIEWQTCKPKSTTKYSHTGAFATVACITIPIFFILLLAANGSKWAGTLKASRSKLGWRIFGICIACATAAYFYLPKVDIQLGRSTTIYDHDNFWFTRNMMKQFQIENIKTQTESPELTNTQPNNEHSEHADAFENYIHKTPKPYLSIDQFREITRLYFEADKNSTRSRLNIKTLEEDSPFNHTLRQLDNGVEFTWYDNQGGPHTIEFTKESIEKFDSRHFPIY